VLRAVHQRPLPPRETVGDVFSTGELGGVKSLHQCAEGTIWLVYRTMRLPVVLSGEKELAPHLGHHFWVSLFDDFLLTI
jgi:hypothetical protein